MTASADERWALEPATDTDIDEIMTWFPDAASVDIWGGPVFRYPFSAATFREDLHLDEMATWALHRPDGVLAAFGQTYERYGRGHLARLVSNPDMRRQGAGRRLIECIIDALETSHDYDEYSLFVYRHNEPAYRCYRSLGFGVVDYPEDAEMPDKCLFLTRKAQS
ncbi:MAG: GNAT family N-acetyltransferase [Woeseiaceae bacterium]|nr:GNAT family N-acetyltransferase [Woeseiaceae bacterium]